MQQTPLSSPPIHPDSIPNAYMAENSDTNCDIDAPRPRDWDVDFNDSVNQANPIQAEDSNRQVNIDVNDLAWLALHEILPSGIILSEGIVVDTRRRVPEIDVQISKDVLQWSECNILMVLSSKTYWRLMFSPS